MRGPSSSVLVCRGCCCGTSSKHPDVDHDAHLATLRAAAAASSVKLWTVDCLGPCERSNVVVVRTGTHRRWFGELLTDADIDVLAGWLRDGRAPSVPAELAPHEFLPQEAPPTVATGVALAPGALVDLLEGLLREGSSNWSLGVHGAVAEFDGTDPRRRVTRHGAVIEAVTPDAALRVQLQEDVSLFTIDKPGTDEPLVLIVAVPARVLAPARSVLCELGPDEGAWPPGGSGHPGSCWGTLFDLGVGRRAVSFAVRAEGALADSLRALVGRTLDETLGELGHELRQQVVPRVVQTAAGRLEIYAPIPPIGAQSPAGSHTHLQQGELDLGLDLPAGMELPQGMVPAAVIRPPMGFALPGRRSAPPGGSGTSGP